MAPRGKPQSPTLLQLKDQVERKSYFLSSMFLQNSDQGKGGSRGWDCSHWQEKDPKQTRTEPVFQKWQNGWAFVLRMGFILMELDLKAGPREGGRELTGQCLVLSHHDDPDLQSLSSSPSSKYMSARDRSLKHPIPQT